MRSFYAVGNQQRNRFASIPPGGIFGGEAHPSQKREYVRVSDNAVWGGPSRACATAGVTNYVRQGADQGSRSLAQLSRSDDGERVLQPEDGASAHPLF